eukprot:509267-Prorocentrum_minimum.AAC.1
MQGATLEMGAKADLMLQKQGIQYPPTQEVMTRVSTPAHGAPPGPLIPAGDAIARASWQLRAPRGAASWQRKAPRGAASWQRRAPRGAASWQRRAPRGAASWQLTDADGGDARAAPQRPANMLRGSPPTAGFLRT